MVIRPFVSGFTLVICGAPRGTSLNRMRSKEGLTTDDKGVNYKLEASCITVTMHCLLMSLIGGYLATVIPPSWVFNFPSRGKRWLIDDDILSYDTPLVNLWRGITHDWASRLHLSKSFQWRSPCIHNHHWQSMLKNEGDLSKSFPKVTWQL